MIPSEKTLEKLKAEIHVNAVRLFVDACCLHGRRSYGSALALAILSLEELGKLEMVDHICDDICLCSGGDGDKQDLLKFLFSRPMFLNHKNKQMWATEPSIMRSLRDKRNRDIYEGVLDKAKQDALYVGYSKRRIRSPRSITCQEAYAEISIVFRQIGDVGDLGFNGFRCWSDAQSRARGSGGI